MYKEVDGRWGRCTFFAKDEYVGRSMYNYGEYGPDETELILSLAEEGMGYCLDIGANIGVISQALLSIGERVHAFEPQPEVYKLLVKNMEAVGGEFTHHNTAIGNFIGGAEMPKVHYSAKGNFGGLSIGSNSIYGTYSVPVVTIDSFWFPNVKFMKIDVEGFELEVLEGAKETIGRCKPIMYIEDDRSDKSKALRQKIEELGYTFEEHYPTLYRENNFFGLKKNVWDKNYASHNLICRPC